MNNKKNIKIKRSKGRLYKKRRSPAKTVIETVVLILLAGGLIYVGYNAAGPLISYIQNGGGSGTVTGWTPAESNPNGSQGNGTDNPSSVQTSEITTARQEASSNGTYLLSQSALKSKKTLDGALENAKKSGFGTVIIPLKDTTGKFLYKTQIDYIKDIKELAAGALSAKDIADAVKSKGLVPKAVIPTLMDKTSPDRVNDTGYYFVDEQISWYDNDPAKGGKPWVDPYRAGAKKYYSDILNELRTAGFEEIALSELRYPDFHDSDRPRVGEKYFSADRYRGLSEFYQSCYNAANKKAAVSVNIKDVLDGKGQSFLKTAEILADKSFSGKVFLTLRLSDFGETLELAQGDPITLPADAAKKAEILIGKASEYIGTNVTVVPVIDGEGMSMEALVKCYKEITP